MFNSAVFCLLFFIRLIFIETLPDSRTDFVFDIVQVVLISLNLVVIVMMSFFTEFAREPIEDSFFP